MKKFLSRVLDILGLRRNSKFVSKHLEDANMRSGIYMAGIIVLIEIWMIIRRLVEDVPERMIPAAQGGRGEDFWTAFFRTSSSFFLLISMGIAMTAFCIYYIDTHKTKAKTIWVIALSVPCLFFGSLFGFERLYDDVSNFLMYTVYLSVLLFGIVVIASTLCFHFSLNSKSKALQSPWLKSRLVIILFAFICLAFGVRVSYSDFFSSSALARGEYKQIICFLMMTLYVGCLLIWRPLISLGILGASFLGFYFFLRSNESVRAMPDGDLVNYITFFISLTIICFSIYNQRVGVAKTEEQLNILATTDTLTGQMSFNYFLKKIDEEQKSGYLEKNKWVFLFIDVLSFKLINEQKGFDEGNKCLAEIAKIIKKHYENDFVSRQADDHFVVFCKNKDIVETLESVNQEVAAIDPEIGLSIHVGGYVFSDRNEDVHRCVDKARYACYAGRRIRLYTEYDKAMHDDYHLKQYIIRNVDKAAEEGWIQPFYQPVVWAKNNRLCGLEALARWDDPVYGFLPPSKFVPALESNQLIHKLDTCIVEIVCRDIRKRIDDGTPTVPVSINFSRLDFELMDAVEVLDNIVRKYNVPKELLHVEITESALMDDTSLLHDAVKRLHEKGYALWLDDFGSGYSSLNVLKDYEFDVLKIDMKFLSGFESNDKAKTLIRAIISMAESIGMKTLTEGVETPEEAAFLKEAACGRLQGYLYGKPLRYSELLEKIESKELIISDELA